MLTKQCSLAQFRADATGCPGPSKVGSATASSPLLPGSLNGPVVIVKPGKGQYVPRLGVDLRGPLSLQVLGSFVLSPALGNAFANLPDIPISDFSLHFRGGSGGLLATSVNLCTAPPPVFQAGFIGWNNAGLGANVPATITGCS